MKMNQHGSSFFRFFRTRRPRYLVSDCNVLLGIFPLRDELNINHANEPVISKLRSSWGNSASSSITTKELKKIEYYKNCSAIFIVYCDDIMVNTDKRRLRRITQIVDVDYKLSCRWLLSKCCSICIANHWDEGHLWNWSIIIEDIFIALFSIGLTSTYLNCVGTIDSVTDLFAIFF